MKSLKIVAITALLAVATSSQAAVDLSSTHTTGHSTTTTSSVTKVTGNIKVMEVGSFKVKGIDVSKTPVNPCDRSACTPSDQYNNGGVLTADITQSVDKLTVTTLNQKIVGQGGGSEDWCDVSFADIGYKNSKGNNYNTSVTTGGTTSKVTGSSTLLKDYSQGWDGIGSVKEVTVYDQVIKNTVNNTTSVETQTVTSGAYLN